MKIAGTGIVAVALGAMAAHAQTACTQTPADQDADERARALLCYLSTHTYISGQTDEKDAVTVQGWTGRYPAIVARDFYHYTDGNTGETQLAIDFFRKTKGIVAFQWHWKAPRPSGRGDYYDDFDYPAELANPASQLNKDIKLVASEIRKMSDAGVPIMFRPLHEANNNFMWWQRHGQDNYKKLWRALFNAVKDAGARNVVWNFNGMASGQGTSLASWYPGDDVVDVISSDYYQSWSDYNSMKAIGKNKTLGVAETWFALDPAKDPPFSHSVVWASKDWADSRHGGTEAVKAAWITAMKDARTISVDQLRIFDLGAPVVAEAPVDRRFSNTQSSAKAVVDLAKTFRDTSKLIWSMTISGSSAITASLDGSRLDLAFRKGDTGTALVTLVATNAKALSASVAFSVHLKDYHKGNRALHQPASSSSNDPYAPDPNAAFDGGVSTRWSSGYADGEWLQVDLDSTLRLDSVSIAWEDAYARDWDLLVSTDSINWIPAASRIGSAGGEEGLAFPSVEARWVRLRGATRATTYGVSLWELRLFGPEEGTTASPARALAMWTAPRIAQAGDALRLFADGFVHADVMDVRGRLVARLEGNADQGLPLPRLRPGIYQASIAKGRMIRFVAAESSR